MTIRPNRKASWKTIMFLKECNFYYIFWWPYHQYTWQHNMCDHNWTWNLFPPHLIIRLDQDLVILAECNQKHDGRDILKAVDPLPPFWPLTPNIHHPDGGTMEGKKEPSNRGQKESHWLKLECVVNLLAKSQGNYITCHCFELLLQWNRENRRNPGKPWSRVSQRRE